MGAGNELTSLTLDNASQEFIARPIDVAGKVNGLSITDAFIAPGRKEETTDGTDVYTVTLIPG